MASPAYSQLPCNIGLVVGTHRGINLKSSVLNTVEPLYSGQHWDGFKCPESLASKLVEEHSPLYTIPPPAVNPLTPSSM